MFGQLKDKAINLLEGTYAQDKNQFKTAFNDVKNVLNQPVLKEFNRIYEEFRNTHFDNDVDATLFVNEGISTLKALDQSKLTPMAEMLSEVELGNRTDIYEHLDSLVFGNPTIKETVELKKSIGALLVKEQKDDVVVNEELQPLMAALIEKKINRLSEQLTPDQAIALTMLSEGGDNLKNYYNDIINECKSVLSNKIKITNDPEVKSELSEAMVKLDSIVNEPSVSNIESVIELKSGLI